MRDIERSGSVHLPLPSEKAHVRSAVVWACVLSAFPVTSADPGSDVRVGASAVDLVQGLDVGLLEEAGSDCALGGASSGYEAVLDSFVCATGQADFQDSVRVSEGAAEVEQRVVEVCGLRVPLRMDNDALHLDGLRVDIQVGLHVQTCHDGPLVGVQVALDAVGGGEDPGRHYDGALGSVIAAKAKRDAGPRSGNRDLAADHAGVTEIRSDLANAAGPGSWRGSGAGGRLDGGDRGHGNGWKIAPGCRWCESNGPTIQVSRSSQVREGPAGRLKRRSIALRPWSPGSSVNTEVARLTSECHRMHLWLSVSI